MLIDAHGPDLHDDTGPGTRGHAAVAASVLLLVINAIGLASDGLQPRYGADSLRVVLACLAIVYAWSALHHAAAGRRWVSEARPD